MRPAVVEIARWAVLWRSVRTVCSEERHFMFDGGGVVLRKSRREAREWIDKHYSYLRTRPDLRREPFGWRMPRAVKVKVTVEELIDEQT